VWPPEHLPGEGPKVAVLAGCVQSVVFGDVNVATARVLHAEGYDVHVPRAQACCGALYAHAGRLDDGLAKARELGDVEAVVRTGAGLRTYLQPIVDLRFAQVAGFEALTRFDGSQVTADCWFAVAQLSGLGPELEALALRTAFERRHELAEALSLLLRRPDVAACRPERADS